MEAAYWHRSDGSGRLTRRQFAGAAAFTGLAAAAAGLVGCSSTNNKAATAAAKASAAPAQSAAATPGAATRAAAAVSPTPAAYDPTKGKPGGSFVMQTSGALGALQLVSAVSPTTSKYAGLVYSGLLAFNFGRPPSDGIDVQVELDLAAAMPEQTDDVTYVVKLRPATFQNGRALTSEDIKYSYEAYAHDPKSAVQTAWLWYDSMQTPDPQTVVIKTKGPFADAVTSMANHAYGFILAKEFEEGPDAGTKLMGSGAFLWDTNTPPVSTTLKKFPNYFNKPYPYFDQMTVLQQGDPAKQVSEFVSRQVHFSNYFDPASTKAVKQGRPDAVEWAYFSTANAFYPRCDQAPFSDKRVRQALSMGIDRKAVRDTTSGGDGRNDQLLSPEFGAKWGFRWPEQLPSAKVWNYDPQGAKQLMAAAGFDKPIDVPLTYSTSVPFPDQADLIGSQWKQNGIANVKEIPLPQAQYSATVLVGNYDNMALGVSNQQQPVFGTIVKNIFWSPPEGVKPPTQNVGHTNDPQLSALLEKQLQQTNFQERLQTLHQIEEIFGDQQYRIVLSTYPLNYFTDPSVKGAVVPKWAYSNSAHYIQYWWFG